MMEPTPEMFHSILDTFKSMMDTQSVVQALQKVEVFRQKCGDFGTELAQENGDGPKNKPM
jgi:hypothetical protein